MGKSEEDVEINSPNTEKVITPPTTSRNESRSSLLRVVYIFLCIFILFINYFLAQYDKFILSYFQTSFSASLDLSPTQYGVISGYSTGIAYALLALPIAFLADYIPSSRVWVLTIASLWWSVCVIFQSIANNFWEVFLARIAMGIGQAAVEPLSISLISDLVGGWRNVFLGEGAFYVGVYIGEAVSGQIAVAFPDDDNGWRIALRAIGITGLVVAVVLRLVIIREPSRREGLLDAGKDESVGRRLAVDRISMHGKFGDAKTQLRDTISYLIRMRSFWLIVASASFRQLSGNVFGYYMPSYLGNTYPDHEELLSRYGIIVGVVGTVSVLSGGLLTSILWSRTKLTPLYLTAIGGMISSVFVLLMIFSREAADGNENQGVKVLYGVMSAAYLTAETWLGALAALIALLLPPQYKTFGLAIWSTIQVLVYSAGPEIMGLALRDLDPSSAQYTKDTQVALAVLIPLGYWMAGIGLLWAVPLLKRDLRQDFARGPLSKGRKVGSTCFLGLLAAVTIALFVADVVYSAT